jgi:hypothetical protein
MARRASGRDVEGAAVTLIDAKPESERVVRTLGGVKLWKITWAGSGSDIRLIRRHRQSVIDFKNGGASIGLGGRGFVNSNVNRRPIRSSPCSAPRRLQSGSWD